MWIEANRQIKVKQHGCQVKTIEYAHNDAWANIVFTIWFWHGGVFIGAWASRKRPALNGDDVLHSNTWKSKLYFFFSPLFSLSGFAIFFLFVHSVGLGATAAAWKNFGYLLKSFAYGYAMMSGVCVFVLPKALHDRHQQINFISKWNSERQQQQWETNC